MTHGWSEVEISEHMMGPRRSAIRAFVHYNQLSGGVDWMGSKVYVVTMNSSVSGQFRVEFGRTEMIDGEYGDGE